MSRPELARSAGLSNGTLRGIERPGFSPSVKTLKALEAVIPADYRPTAQPAARRAGVEIAPYVEGHSSVQSTTIVSEKYYLDRDTADQIDKAQIAKIRQASEQWSDPDGRIPEERLNRELLKVVAPQAAIHIIKVTDPSPEGFLYEVWDNGTGWRNSAELSGHRVADASDPILRDCTFEDFMVVREFGWPSLVAISRYFVEGENRPFLRYLHPIAGRDGSLKILCVCRPQEFHA